MVLSHSDVVEDLLQFPVKVSGLIEVSVRVPDVDVAVAVGRHAVLWYRQVLGGEPEVHRMPGYVGQRPLWG